MPKRIVPIVLLAVLIPLVGCFTVRHSYDGPLILTSDASVEGREMRTVRHFEARDRQFFWLHGGYPVGEDLNGAELAAAQAEGHDAVVNLHLTDGQDFRDVVITHVPCLLSLLCGTWSVWVEGDVADFQEVPR
jgi:hypothetical protein